MNPNIVIHNLIKYNLITVNLMDILAERLNTKLNNWQPDIATQVRIYIQEIIELADQETIDIIRSRSVEQEVLDILDYDPKTR